MFKSDDTLQLNGKTYRVTKKLGEGGQVQAWEVASESDEATFALRVVNPFDERAGRKSRRTPSALHSFNQRMRDEITFLQQLPDALAHYILPCLDSGTLDYQGVKLEAMLAPLMQDELSSYCPNLTHDPKPFTPEKLLLWLSQLSTALAYVHQKDSNDTLHVHRDLKPSNVLMDAEGNIFLTDFGILKAARSIGTNSIAFNNQCCAPEQRLPLYLLEETENGEKKSKRQYHITPKADIYALGMVIHNLLLGSTRAQDDLAEISVADEHVREIPTLQTPPVIPEPIGDLGKLGGLLVVEQKALLKKLTTWLRPTLSNGGTFIPTDTADAPPSLPDYPWLAERMTQLISQMLKPWPEHRPSAEAVQREISELQKLLFPTVTVFTLSCPTTFPVGQAVKCVLDMEGRGLDNGNKSALGWLSVTVDDVPQAVSWNLVDEINGMTVLHNWMIINGPLAQGKHTLVVEALVAGQTYTARHTFTTVMSTQQLWEAGQHETALTQELRPEWLEQQLASLTNVSTAYAFMQMLERLKIIHPAQIDKLETFKQQADQRFIPKQPASESTSTAKRKPIWLFGKSRLELREKPSKPERVIVIKLAMKLMLKQMFVVVINLATKLKRLIVTKLVATKLKRIIGMAMWMIAGFIGVVLLSDLVKVEPSPESSVDAALLENLRSKDAAVRKKAYTELEALAEDPANSNAQQWMGYRYLMGDGVKIDLQVAKTWYRKAEDSSSTAVTQLVEIDKALNSTTPADR